MTMTKGKYFSTYIKGESLSAFSNIAAKLAGLVSSFFIIRSLSVYHFGLYHLVLAAIDFISTFTKGAFDGIIATELKVNFRDKNYSFVKRLLYEYGSLRIMIGLVLMIAVFFGSDFIALHYRSDIASFVKIMSLFFLFENLQATGKMFLKTIRSMKIFILDGINDVVKMVLVVGFVYFRNLGMREVFIAQVSALGITALIVLGIALNYYFQGFPKVKPSPNFVLGRVFKSFGKIFAFRYVFSRITSNAQPWIIRLFLNTEAVAFYSLSLDLVGLFQGIFPTNTFGFLILGIEKTDKKSFAHFYIKAIKYVFLLSLIVIGGAFIITPFAVNLLFPKYNPIVPIFMIMLLSLPFKEFCSISKGTLSILREYKILTSRLILDFISDIFLLSLLARFFGLMGVAVEHILKFLTRFFFLYFSLIRKYSHLKLNIKDMIKFDQYDRELIVKVFKRLIFKRNTDI